VIAPARFHLAPMQPWLRVLTYALFVLPAALLLGARASPPPASLVLLGASVFVLLSYASVWLVWRPTCFEVGSDGLRIVWPTRSRLVPGHTIEDARVLSGPDFRREYGWGMRVGAGGLWGGFGLLRTRTATFSMWISRTDELVLVRLRGARPLLVTPEAPRRFVEQLLRRVG
jgi:hypothetical protein